MTTRRTHELRSLNDVPHVFDSEAQEAEFWDTHSFGDTILSRLQPASDPCLPSVRRPMQPVSIRFPDALLAALKAAAAEVGVPYQTLLKQILAEGLRAWRKADQRKRRPGSAARRQYVSPKRSGVT